MSKRTRDRDRAREARTLSRRSFVGGGAALAVLGGAALARRGGAPPSALAATGATAPSASPAADAERAYVPRPGRTEYALSVEQVTLDPDGEKEMPAITVNGTLPGPEIRVREGEIFRAVVANRLADSPTTIHWHGLLVPAAMDGVPDISNVPIAPRGTYVYEYPIRQSGTYWYHSHVGFQEQQGMFGAFVIEAKDDPVRAEHDVVVLMSDWLHRSPMQVFEELRGKKNGDESGAAANAGGANAAEPRGNGGATPGMKMDASGAKPDLADVKYSSFLLNGKAPNAPWTFAAQPGERIRLRLINSGASTFFRVSLDEHPLEVVHADGLAVEPVTVEQILMGNAECYDVVVKLTKSGSYTLHAVAQDGSGQAIGVLHTPDAKPQPNRSMPAAAPESRTLRYAQLRAPAPTVLPAGETRRFRLPLQGDMKGYVWMIDGQAWPDADPLVIKPGDRVELELVNQSMMWHPMHLHGHFFRVLQGAGDFCPLKHTVSVAPGETIRIEFAADNPGRWFFHCHNLYHLEAGMAREFVYEV
ncbi:MAG TPA: multicopper oxidase domain-containing protein [Candidatus Binatia bacterium]